VKWLLNAQTISTPELASKSGLLPSLVNLARFNCRDAAIKPLVEGLSFIRSKTHWGAAFRFGHIKVSEADFALIADAMKPASAPRHA
jgi:hypothetical protein